MTTLHEWQRPILGSGQTVAGIVLELQRRKGGDDGAAVLNGEPNSPPSLEFQLPEPDAACLAAQAIIHKAIHNHLISTCRTGFSRLVQRSRDGSDKE
jgi:hypothetical protein